ncbi:MAG: hydroxymethylglutaryl-CoA lyase [Ferruginibacter sp.]
MKMIKIVECPRDAMQGWPNFIPTAQKINYLKNLLQAGFDTLDFGSFVSAKAIPQLADTKEVLMALESVETKTKLLAIVANLRGAEDAMLFDKINVIGYPFSISETFQLRNTNATVATSLDTVKDIQELCLKNNKTLLVYLSMAFGNPYGDPFNASIVLDWLRQLTQLEIQEFAIADTVGIASPEEIHTVLSSVVANFPTVDIGVHLHSTSAGTIEKLDAALNAGCKKFDGAIKGIGGCPMSGSELIGNIDTEVMVKHFIKKGFYNGIDTNQLANCSSIAAEIFV